MTGDKNQTALLHHIMRLKQERAEKAALGLKNEPLSGQVDDGIVHMTETRIYVGLNDPETKEQKYETEKYLGILKKVCQSYHVAFSVDIEEGGYYHEDGTYTEETSFVLLMIGADRETVRKIAKDLCAFFGQEAVLVTENHLDGYFISEDVSL